LTPLPEVSNTTSGERAGTLTARVIAGLVNGELRGEGDTTIDSVAPLGRAAKNQLSFLGDGRYAQALAESLAGVVLVTPELAAVSVSFGADESAGKVLAAAAIALLPALLAARARRRETSALAAQFLAALQIVVAIALAVSGIRDV